jgi:hypothetical protein
MVVKFNMCLLLLYQYVASEDSKVSIEYIELTREEPGEKLLSNLDAGGGKRVFQIEA